MFAVCRGGCLSGRRFFESDGKTLEMSLDQWFELNRQRARRAWVHGQNNLNVRAMSLLVARHTPVTAERPVIVFNASTRLEAMSLNAAFSLLVSWSLRLAGVPVVHFACKAGMSRCVLGTRRDDLTQPPPCGRCALQSRAFYENGEVRWLEPAVEPALAAALARLGLDELCSFVYHDLPLGELVLPSARWILRRHHLVDDEPTRSLYRDYIQSAWQVARQFERVLDEFEPQAVLVFNGMFFPEATARRLAERRGIRVVTHEVGLQPFSGFFTTGDATAYPIDIPETFELSPEQSARLDAYLEQRFRGNFSMAGVRFWPEMRSLSAEFLQRIAAYRQVVPVFTNVIFDTSQGHANVVFEHMFAWLDEVLAIIRAHPETFFVLRAHPDEARPGKESRESVAEWAQRNRIAELDNVLFVDAGEYFSSYELIQRSKFVMVYNSTIGLEAALMGAAVLCAGRARFTQLPTVFFPASPQVFRRVAEDFLAAERVEVPAEFQRNARRFLYYQLFRSSLPFGDFLQEDGVWRGYVTLKRFGWRALLPENSLTLRTVVAGICDGKSFLLDE